MKPVKFQPQQFEKKWIKYWNENGTYKAESQKGKGKSQKMYTLSMFPYPSGAGLHVGHVRIYTGTDVLARYFRMKGYSVLHPMGWDAFGLPAENAAIKAKKNPMDMVPANIANFKRQMDMVGLSHDWSREFSTTDPEYYKWTQWLFIQFFKKGLLFKKDMPVFYCPFCKTGLSEEEVLPNGTHERCGNAIERRVIPQWVFKITTYAERLLNELDGLDWPDGILEMQRNWIGKSEGADVEFALEKDASFKITVFTTRPDTLFGVTGLVIAPEHKLTQKILSKEIEVDQKNAKEVAQYVEETSKKLDLQRTDLNKDKTGVFTGLYVINPVNGEKIPVWVADYVLGYYGHGAVMMVPAHDERDFEFAKKFGVEIRPVIETEGSNKKKNEDKCYTGVGYIIASEQVKAFFEDTRFFDKKILSSEFKKLMIQAIEEKKFGKRVVQYKLRDWIFSRQRYWGEPIPMVYCEKCAQEGKSAIGTSDMAGWFPLSEDQLPLKLPYVQSYEPPETGESPLATIESFVKTVCPNCGSEAKRETDTMPNWAGSCWYFLRFADPHNDTAAWDMKCLKEWEPVDWYLGGAEHAVLHLLYARFWVKALQDMGLVPFNEPFMRLRNVGMVLAEDNRKMSKSWGNVINPDDVVAEYGADALRLYEMFMAPFNQENAWSTSALQGTYRFLTRVWRLTHDSMVNGQNEDKKLVHKLNKTIQKVSTDIAETKFNTAIAAMMEFINDWEKSKSLGKENVKKFVQILAPFAPFMTEELWQTVLGESSSIHLSEWPHVNESDLVESDVSIPVQVNGRMRGLVVVSRDKTDEQTVVSKALEDERVKTYIGEKAYKVIYVNEKILNFIV